MTIAIVHFVIEPGLGAGVAVKAAALSRALVDAGESVRLITTGLGFDARPAPPLPRVDLILLSAIGRRFPIPRTTIRALTARLRGCDAVILFNHWTALNAMAASAAHRAGVPIVFCPAGALTVQGRSTMFKRIYQALVGGRLIADASALLATTPLEARQFEAAGAPASKIAVIPNAVNDHPDGQSADDFRRAHGLGDAPLLLFMGRLNPIKGPDLLLEAFGRVAGRFPSWRLVFAGADEGLAPALRERVRLIGLSQCAGFAGLLGQPAAVGAYRAASLLAVPSRHEAMSQVALEAGVVGTPVLLTAACGFDDVQRVGGGRVVAATVDGLAAGLEALLSTPDQLPEMGARLQAFVRQHYSWPVIVRKYVELLTSVRRP